MATAREGAAVDAAAAALEAEATALQKKVEERSGPAVHVPLRWLPEGGAGGKPSVPKIPVGNALNAPLAGSGGPARSVLINVRHAINLPVKNQELIKKLVNSVILTTR